MSGLRPKSTQPRHLSFFVRQPRHSGLLSHVWVGNARFAGRPRGSMSVSFAETGQGVCIRCMPMISAVFPPTCDLRTPVRCPVMPPRSTANPITPSKSPALPTLTNEDIGVYVQGGGDVHMGGLNTSETLKLDRQRQASAYA